MFVRFVSCFWTSDIMQTLNLDVVSSVATLSMVLKWLYPCRYGDIIPKFGRSVYELHSFNRIFFLFHARFSYFSSSLDQACLSSENLLTLQIQFIVKGVHLEFVGFLCLIDGILKACIRLGENQRVFYNGHKYVNGITFYGSFMNHLWKFNFNIFGN